MAESSQNKETENLQLETVLNSGDKKPFTNFQCKIDRNLLKEVPGTLQTKLDSNMIVSNSLRQNEATYNENGKWKESENFDTYTNMKLRMEKKYFLLCESCF